MKLKGLILYTTGLTLWLWILVNLPNLLGFGFWFFVTDIQFAMATLIIAGWIGIGFAYIVVMAYLLD